MSISEKPIIQRFKVLHGYSADIENKLNELAETNFVVIHKMVYTGGGSNLIVELEPLNGQRNKNPFDKKESAEQESTERYGGFLLH